MGLLGRFAVGMARVRGAAIEGGRLADERRTAAADRRKAIEREMMMDNLTRTRQTQADERAVESDKREGRRLEQASVLQQESGKRDQERINLERERVTAAMKTRLTGEQAADRAGDEYADQFPELVGLPTAERVRVGGQTLAANLRPRTVRPVNPRAGLVPPVPTAINARIVNSYRANRRRTPAADETEATRAAARELAISQALRSKWITQEQATSFYGPNWNP